MGFIILLLAIHITIYITVYTSSDISDKKSNIIISFIISNGFSIFIIGMILGSSYESYLDMQSNLKTIEQYGDTIDLYSKKGVKEFKFNPDILSLTSVMTDLKYHKYQEQLGKMFIDLRDQITKYNKILTSKSIMNNSWFWNYLIIMPDNNKIIKMNDYVD